MITIHNEEACNEAMQLAWDDQCGSLEPMFRPRFPSRDFRNGFRYAYMIVELKEAEIDLMGEGE